MSGLPEWAVVKPTRRAHIERVAGLVERWADLRGLAEAEKKRWLDAAWLHDALRDEKKDALRAIVPEAFKDWPGSLLHGPAAAAMLRKGGAADEGVLHAITYHTVGHPDFDDAGRILYLADFLEPGRTYDPIGRAVLRARMPHDESAVLREVLRNRMTHLIDANKKMRSETVAFWNGVA